MKRRPPLRGAAKRQVTLRLDPDGFEKVREGGPGLQAWMNEALRKAAGLD
ncbi:BrnA antitoxin family protein [Sphingomonas sp. 37zxx]|nr:BrnA antitoxin family protein [Sphingomonas sp. 37zxx]